MLSAPDRERLVREAWGLGVSLSEDQVERLDRYVRLLLDWNPKVNLTAVTDPAAIVDKHLLDCLALVPLVGAADTLVDIGTGPGLPSVVLAIACPDLTITGVESIQKKAMFVRTVSRELKLALTVDPIRLEQLGQDRTFDIAVSRATFEPTEWVERATRLVNERGRIIAMLSAQQAGPEPPPGFTALPLIKNEIGGEVRRVAAYVR